MISMFFTQFFPTFSQSVIKFYGILDYPNSLLILLSEQKKLAQGLTEKNGTLYYFYEQINIHY